MSQPADRVLVLSRRVRPLVTLLGLLLVPAVLPAWDALRRRAAAIVAGSRSL